MNKYESMIEWLESMVKQQRDFNEQQEFNNNYEHVNVNDEMADDDNDNEYKFIMSNDD